MSTIEKKSSRRTAPAAARPGNGQALQDIRIVDLTQFEAGTVVHADARLARRRRHQGRAPGQGRAGTRAPPPASPISTPSTSCCSTPTSAASPATSSTREGKAILRGLIEKADVFIENFGARRDRASRLRLRRGQRDQPAHRLRADQGLRAGRALREASCPSTTSRRLRAAAFRSPAIETAGRSKPGLNVGDTGAGLHCSVGILAALHQRQRTECRSAHRVTMQEAVINFGRIAYAAQDIFGNAGAAARQQPASWARPRPSEVYPCKGGGPNDYCLHLHDPRRQSPMAEPAARDGKGASRVRSALCDAAIALRALGRH